MAKPKRIAIYARVSTSDQDAGMQLDELRDHAGRRGWSIVEEYVDEGVSGSKASRPKLDLLMKDARRRRFDSVLVWRFDRFARSTVHLLAALEEFRNQGIDFISIHEAVDTSTPMGRMVFTVVAAVAELERSLIIERVRAGVARARAKGKRLGRPLGTKIPVAEVGKLIESGLSIRAVAERLGVGVGSVHRAAKAFQKSLPKTGPRSPLKKKRK
ncbi:MAG: recombinase family protein [Planctomycetota bacterium]|nr:recombinase family protein [Planctomycetota bacterium]